MYALTYDWGDDPNPHAWPVADLFDTYEEAERAGEELTRESLDYGYLVVDLGGAGLHYIPTHRPVAAIREMTRILVEELAGPAPPDDDEPSNVIHFIQTAAVALRYAAEELEKGGLE